MPKVYLTEADQLVEKELKALHAELIVQGIRNRTIASWLGCSEQNVSQLWKNCSFSFRQIVAIRHELKKITAAVKEG